MTSQPLNQPAEIPAELDRWNWGAFFLNWIWGIGNSVFIALLMFVPVVNIVMIFVLGARGSRWAWRNRAWRDAEHFRRTQRAWAIAGLISWVAVIGGAVSLATAIPRFMKGSDAYHMTMESVRADPRVTAALGDKIDDGFWIGGNVRVNGDGSGNAVLNIPLQGSKASGVATSHAVRSDWVWTIRLLVVRVVGSDVPIVLINADNVPVPGEALGI
jgi:hypothetical protein